MHDCNRNWSAQSQNIKRDYDPGFPALPRSCLLFCTRSFRNFWHRPSNPSPDVLVSNGTQQDLRRNIRNLRCNAGEDYENGETNSLKNYEITSESYEVICEKQRIRWLSRLQSALPLLQVHRTVAISLPRKESAAFPAQCDRMQNLILHLCICK